MKQLFRNNYITISAIKSILLGIAYADETLVIMVGCIAFEINTYMFKSQRG